jgi:hypothetical protein
LTHKPDDKTLIDFLNEEIKREYMSHSKAMLVSIRNRIQQDAIQSRIPDGMVFVPKSAP